VVAQHPQPSLRDGQVELAAVARRRRLRGVAGVQVRLVQGHAVDGDLVPGVAAGHMVAGDADDPLDVIGLARRRPEQVADGRQQRPEAHVVQRDDRVGAGRLDRGRIPGPRPVEHDDVAGVDRPEMVGQLVDQDLVTDQQRVLHGRRRDEKRLHDERLDQEGDRQRQYDQDHKLLPERTVPAAPASLAAGLAGGSGGLPLGVGRRLLIVRHDRSATAGATWRERPRGARGCGPPCRAARAGSRAWPGGRGRG
jgi:hypothetical protein